MRRIAAVTATVAGLLLLASGLAHAFLGWPELAAEMSQASVTEATLGAARIGWYFGSVAMLTFGVIVTLAGARLLRGRPTAAAPLAAIATAYVGFGGAAFVADGYNPHFLGFIVMGLLVATGAFAARSSTNGA